MSDLDDLSSSASDGNESSDFGAGESSGLDDSESSEDDFDLSDSDDDAFEDVPSRKNAAPPPKKKAKKAAAPPPPPPKKKATPTKKSPVMKSSAVVAKVVAPPSKKKQSPKSASKKSPASRKKASPKAAAAAAACSSSSPMKPMGSLTANAVPCGLAAAGGGKATPSKATPSKATPSKRSASSSAGASTMSAAAAAAAAPSAKKARPSSLLGGAKQNKKGAATSAASSSSASAKAAPPKPKAPVLVATNMNELILNHMVERNRPYSLINVYENLRKAVPKPDCERVLGKLVAQQKLLQKTFGKAVIYWPNQEGLPTDSAPELKEKRGRIAREKVRAGELKGQVEAAHAANGALEAEPTDADLASAIAAETAQLQALEARLATVEGACKSGKAPTAAEKRKLEEEFKSRRSAWAKRKRITMERVRDMVDRQGGGKKELAKLLDEIGCEMDGVDGNSVIPDLLPTNRNAMSVKR